MPLTNLSVEVNEFREARRQAKIQALLAKLKRKPQKLLSFDEVRKELKPTGVRRRYLEDIPIDKIVGSVNRYVDFNRRFYPLQDSDEGRWARIKMVVEEEGVMPIDVFKIGGMYFVMDGNHRVSIARQNDATHIEAFVTELRTKIELTKDDDIHDVIMRAEHFELLEDTRLDELRPDVDIKVTLPGSYRKIYEHIEVHRYYMGLEKNREVTMDEAVISWLDNIYLPAVRAIRDYKVLEDLPNRTEADLYLWLKRHQMRLTGNFKNLVGEGLVAQDLVARYSKKPYRVLVRFYDKSLNIIEKIFKCFSKA
ncbi:MAG: ParB N-terminal domain-containing protein [Chloroflexi bacterium]|jgi:hypothetical protein|nr:ParB N-terminal domain-containing protein [Chloroflexota bacterium]MBT3670824.1 ParB N-terminal domain-containing protein [Chloroflexota bacterium]MBT4002358.1 ParB N-terminal domain-containing protein [Chloroflexota bacterium]MBT4305283.1 ParB N-terminal domain-containing protein [Chloroflexota bacterium]MBT4532429.1 ParB N-terminal domain-containing protein [Chloroflexota bacterium]